MTSPTNTDSGGMTSMLNALPELGQPFGEQLRSRRPEALERFFDLYFDPIYGIARSLARSNQEAEDITQSIFLSIHHSLPRFVPESPLRPWVSSIVHRSLPKFEPEPRRWPGALATPKKRNRDRRRSRRRVRESARSDDRLSPPSIGRGRQGFELEQQWRDDPVKQAVYRLPLGVRSVLLLRIYDGFAFKTIAEILKLTPAAAQEHYSRALKALRKSLPLEWARL